MTIVSIEKEFRQKVSGEVRLLREGGDRYRIFTPFRFEDGDHFAIVMRKEEGGWSLSDEGHTLMRLTYDIDHEDLKKGHRQEIISDALESFAVEERSGELIRRVEGEQFGLALFAFVQTLTKISDVSYLSRERVATAFREDFRALVSGVVAPEHTHFDWADAQRDPNRKYVVDCRIDGSSRPTFAFALLNDDNVRDATIALHQFAQWNVVCRPVGVFYRQESIGRRVLARFSDVCSEHYPSLGQGRDKISEVLAEAALD